MQSPGGTAGGGASISDLVAGALPGILKRGRVIVSPYPFGLSDDDNMRVTAVNSVTGVTVNIHTRRVLRDQSTTADIPTFAPPADRTPTSVDIPLAGGYVTNLSVFTSGAAVLKGQVFVIVQLIRGLGTSATLLGTLLAGYITATQPVGWPGSPIESSTDTEPVIRTIVGTQPGFQTDFSESVPSGARWELLSVINTVDIGTAINKTFDLVLDDGANIVARSFGITTAFPVSNVIFQWWPDLSVFGLNVSGQMMGGLPANIKLLAGYRIRSANNGMSANDRWHAPVITVREWQEGG